MRGIPFSEDPLIVNHEEYRDELLWACFRSFANSSGTDFQQGMLRCYFDSETAALAAVVSVVAEDSLSSMTRCLERADGTAEKLAALGAYLERHAEHLVEQQRFWKAILVGQYGVQELLAHHGKRYQMLLGALFGNDEGSDDLGLALALLIDSLLAQRGHEASVRLDLALLAFGRTVARPLTSHC